MRVLIVTGLSGGHIFPALALAEALKKSGQLVQLVLPEGGRKNNISLQFLQVASLRKKLKNSQNSQPMPIFTAASFSEDRNLEPVRHSNLPSNTPPIIS